MVYSLLILYSSLFISFFCWFGIVYMVYIYIYLGQLRAHVLMVKFQLTSPQRGWSADCRCSCNPFANHSNHSQSSYTEFCWLFQPFRIISYISKSELKPVIRSTFRSTTFHSISGMAPRAPAHLDPRWSKAPSSSKVAAKSFRRSAAPGKAILGDPMWPLRFDSWNNMIYCTYISG